MTGMLRRGWHRLSIYLPIILMALAALGTWQLVRNSVLPGAERPAQAATHEPDYFMRDFSVRSFDVAGKLQSEIIGTDARHYPDTDTLEVDAARMRSINAEGTEMRATANRAVSNADASEVQLFGNAVVVRDAVQGPVGQVQDRMEFRSEFLHTFVNFERVRSHLPVVLTRGLDRFTGSAMEYDNLERVLDLTGSVTGFLVPTKRSGTDDAKRSSNSKGTAPG
ncbi:MAG: LPS export ABC transporter periplasmic protein LptC [Burkholderiales bacterium]